jgi:hypothetical protein
VLVAHIIGLTIMFPNEMLHIFAFIGAIVILITYVKERLRLEDLMIAAENLSIEPLPYEVHNEIDLKLKSSGCYLT